MRRPLDGLALICGAMAPDLPYYIRSTPLPVTAQSWYEPFTNATTSHSPAALVTVTLPLALVVYLVVRAAVPPLVWLVGGRWDLGALHLVGAVPGRADGLATNGLARWAWIPVSLLIGASTHLVWDSLTSGDGFLAERFDALNEVALADLTWVRSLQHVSTAVGLALVAVALLRHRRLLLSHDGASQRGALRLLAALVAVGLVAGAASVLATVDSSASTSTRDLVENVASTAVMGGAAAVGLVVLIVTGFWWLARLGTKQSRTAASP